VVRSSFTIHEPARVREKERANEREKMRWFYSSSSSSSSAKELSFSRGVCSWDRKRYEKPKSKKQLKTFRVSILSTKKFQKKGITRAFERKREREKKRNARVDPEICWVNDEDKEKRRERKTSSSSSSSSSSSLRLLCLDPAFYVRVKKSFGKE